MMSHTVIITFTALFCVAQAKPSFLKKLVGLLGDSEPEVKHVYETIGVPDDAVLRYHETPSHGWEDLNINYVSQGGWLHNVNEENENDVEIHFHTYDDLGGDQSLNHIGLVGGHILPKLPLEDREWPYNSRIRIHYKEAPQYYHPQPRPVYGPPKIEPSYLPPQHIPEEMYGPPKIESSYLPPQHIPKVSYGPPQMQSSYLPQRDDEGFGPYPAAAPHNFQPQPMYYHPPPPMMKVEEKPTTANPLVELLGGVVKAAGDIVTSLTGGATQVIGAVRPLLVKPKVVRRYYYW